MHPWLIVVLSVLGFALVGALGFAYYAYRTAFYHSERAKRTEPRFSRGEQYLPLHEQMRAMVRDLKDDPCEEISIRAQDGKTLFARYYHVADGAPLQIQAHGYRSWSIHDFSGGNRMAREMGHNVLLVDQRSHGKSEGNVITFGLLERYDLLAWVNYAVERFGKETPIFLSGISMGAATVLMCSALELPESVVGVIADCPYSSPKEIIQKVCRDRGLPPGLAYPFLRLGARLYGGFCLSEEGPITAVRNAKVPVLVIHGEDDRFVPCDMSRRIREASPSGVLLETFPGAGHGISYLVDTERYRRLTESFVRFCLEKRNCRA